MGKSRAMKSTVNAGNSNILNHDFSLPTCFFVFVCLLFEKAEVSQAS